MFIVLVVPIAPSGYRVNVVKEMTANIELDSKLFALGLGSAWLQFAVALVISFLRYALLFKFVPQQDLGLGILLMSAVSFLSIFDATLAPGIATEVGRAWKDKLPGQVVSSCRYVYKQAFRIFLIVSVAILPIVLYVAKSYANQALLIGLWALFSIRAGLAFFSGSKSHILTGTGWYYVGRMGQMAGDLTGLLVLFLTLQAGLGVTAVGIGAVAEGTVAWLVISWFFSKRVGTVFNDPPDAETVRSLRKTSLSILGNSVGVFLIYNTDGFFLARYVSLASVADYNVAYKLALMVSTVCIPFYNAIYPRFVNSLKDSNLKEIGKFFNLVRFNHLLASALSVAILFFGESLINLWVGPGHYVGQVVVAILVVTFMLDNIHYPHGYTFLSKGRSSILMYSALCAGVLNLGLTAYLAPRYGVAGVAAGTLLAQLACANILIPVLSLRELKYGALQYAYTALLPAAAIWAVPLAYFLLH
jgi:O-antigen/teichoic acid export membrane protein